MNQEIRRQRDLLRQSRAASRQAAQSRIGKAKVLDLGRSTPSLGPIPPTDHAAARRWAAALEPMTGPEAEAYLRAYGPRAYALAQLCRAAAKAQDLKALDEAQRALSRTLYVTCPSMWGRD